MGQLFSPLEMACRSMSKEAIELLIEAQADVNLDSGGTATLPIIQACSRSRVNDSLEKENIIRFLIEENWASVVRTRPENVLFSYPIHYASMSCSTQVMELFIKHGALAQLSEPDSLNRQPVHLASYNSLDVLRMLEVPREDFSARDVFGRLPFHCAVLSGHFDLLTHVFEKSKAADPDFTIDSPYSDGWTALHWAARATGILGWENNPKDLNSTQIIQYPLDEGADVCALAHVRPYGDSTLTQTDWLASDIASYHGATDLVSMLEEEKSRHSQDSKLANRSRRKVGEKDDVFFCDACALVRKISSLSTKQNRYISPSKGVRIIHLPILFCHYRVYTESISPVTRATDSPFASNARDGNRCY